MRKGGYQTNGPVDGLSNLRILALQDGDAIQTSSGDAIQTSSTITFADVQMRESDWEFLVEKTNPYTTPTVEIRSALLSGFNDAYPGSFPSWHPPKELKVSGEIVLSNASFPTHSTQFQAPPSNAFPCLMAQFFHPLAINSNTIHPYISLHYVAICVGLAWRGQAICGGKISSNGEIWWGPDAAKERQIRRQIRYGLGSTRWTLRGKPGKISTHTLERCTLSFPRLTSPS